MDSSILAAAVPNFFRPVIPVVWRIEPACDVIETGVLFGTDPSSLTTVGQPIYGYREAYQQEVPVTETGHYWVAGYARDEQGNVIQSPPQVAFVAVPPLSSARSHGSHGAPPVYTGTDDDFLHSAEPHFASLKANSLRIQTSVFSPLMESRLVASTDRNEVLTQLLEPFQIGPRSFTFNAAAIRGALDRLDSLFLQHGFPRPGLYSVGCELSFSQFFTDSRCSPDFASVGRFGDVRLGFNEHREDHIGLDTVFTVTQSARSSATFFIPSSPVGKQVSTARLRAFGGVVAKRQDIPSEIRLNGKPSVATDNLQCFLNPPFTGTVVCIGTFTWDFTEEVRSIAEQGGRELTLIPDPVPLFTGTGKSTITGRLLRFSSGGFSLQLGVDYPWRHGGADGALTLTFEEACPKELNLVLTPDPFESVQPRGLPATIAGVATEVKVDARVKTCPPQPGSPPQSVAVTFMIDPDEPMPGSVDAGGHAHDGSRPKGNFDQPGAGPTVVTCTVTNFDAQGVGTCDAPKTYFPREVSGNVKIIADTLEFGKDEKKVNIQVPGLVNLAGVQTNFFRLTGRTDTHPNNHWGTPSAITNIQFVTLDFFDVFGATLGINDLSLRFGGLFDINGTWNPPHVSHRKGTSVDINRMACVDPNLQGVCSATISVARDFIERRCFGRGRGTLLREPSYHCEWPQ